MYWLFDFAKQPEVETNIQNIHKDYSIYWYSKKYDVFLGVAVSLSLYNQTVWYMYTEFNDNMFWGNYHDVI